jgi:hypothetical protein
VTFVATACGDGNANPDAINPPIDVGDAAVDAPDAGTNVAGCRDGWCWLYPTPQGNELRAVFGFSPTDVWAVGRSSAILHYDGAAWTEHHPPPMHGDDLFTLWGAAPNDVWAGGSNGLYHWNGTSWSSSLSMMTTGVQALGGGAANDVWMADAMYVRQWNGSTWTSRAVPAINGRLLGFWSSGGSIYTVSAGGGIAKWLGTTWGTIDAGSRNVNAASFVDASQIVLAGNAGAVWFYNGSNWVAHDTPTSTAWTSVAAVSLTDVWVTNGRRAAHWNGTTWDEMNLAASEGSGIWRDATGAPWIVTGAQAFKRSGASWSTLTVGVPDLWAVGGSGDNDIWVTTRYGARHWNGSAWSDVTLPAQPSACTTRDLWASGANDVWIAIVCAPEANDLAPRKLLHWNGQAWSTIGPLGHEESIIQAFGFNALWGSGPSDIYAAAHTAVYHFDGNTWSPITNGPPGGDVAFGLSSNDLYIAKTNQLWHWNGAWSSRTSPNTIVGGWQNAANDVWLGGTTSGNHFDGTVFTPAPFEAVPVGTASEMFVHEDRETARYAGGVNGTRTAAPAFFDFADTWRSPSGRLYVISGNPGGLLYREP